MSISSLFPSCPVLMVGGTGPDHPLCSGAFHFFFFFEMFHLLIVSFFDFFFIVLRCETVSPSGRSTHSVREKRVTFSSKTSSGNIKPCDQRKKNAQVLTYLSILFILQ